MDSPQENVTAIHRRDIAATLDVGTAAVTAVGESLGRKPDRSEVWKVAAVAAAVAAIVAVLISVPLALAGARQQARQEVRTESLAAAQEETRQRADAAFRAAQEANAELERRGQPQVPVPHPDDQGGQEDTLVAAAVAGTLAALPEQVKAPSAQDLGRAVAAYMAANPAPGPSPAQIAEAVAAFLRANPPAAGPQGETGPAGPSGAPGEPGEPGKDGQDGADAPPPTEGEIRDAVAAVLAENPNILCTSTGGTWVRLDNVVIDEEPDNPLNRTTTRTLWACVE